VLSASVSRQAGSWASMPVKAGPVTHAFVCHTDNIHLPIAVE
jgi:hypothetical protein